MHRQQLMCNPLIVLKINDLYAVTRLLASGDQPSISGAHRLVPGPGSDTRQAFVLVLNSQTLDDLGAGLNSLIQNAICTQVRVLPGLVSGAVASQGAQKPVHVSGQGAFKMERLTGFWVVKSKFCSVESLPAEGFQCFRLGRIHKPDGGPEPRSVHGIT